MTKAKEVKRRDMACDFSPQAMFQINVLQTDSFATGILSTKILCLFRVLDYTNLLRSEPS